MRTVFVKMANKQQMLNGLLLTTRISNLVHKGVSIGNASSERRDLLEIPPNPEARCEFRVDPIELIELRMACPMFFGVGSCKVRCLTGKGAPPRASISITVLAFVQICVTFGLPGLLTAAVWLLVALCSEFVFCTAPSEACIVITSASQLVLPLPTGTQSSGPTLYWPELLAARAAGSSDHAFFPGVVGITGHIDSGDAGSGSTTGGGAFGGSTATSCAEWS
mmetsp:Transcript_156383/g.291866  ORF Transcript_156383/g.291866 Transcript_156383/m.291866 type:complete len:222 (-) Transcript_156383:482-1147(-)